MADISKINPNGTEYNLKDATARAGIESSKTLKSSVVTVNDAAPINAEDITVDITPNQDLHGYDRPWAGGAGKNKLPLTVANLKSINNAYSSVWNGNTYTVLGMSYEIKTDTDGNVVGINVNGTTSAYPMFYLFKGTLPLGTYTFNTSSNIRYRIYKGTSLIYDGTVPKTFTVSDSTVDYEIYIFTGATTVNNEMAYPMIRLATETATTFAPYSNICPIEGRTGAELDRDGKNWLNPNTIKTGKVINYTNGAIMNNAAYWTSDYIDVHDASYIACSGTAYFNSAEKWFYDKDKNPLQRAPLNVSVIPVPTGAYYYCFSRENEYSASDGMVERGNTVTPYEPYQGQQYTASFGETVYGGEWHVTEGGTDKTHANIANYNGETINEPWISSMDEYSPGATPTTGAQVVYPLTTPTTISTRKQNVPMLQGVNTVYADCGDTSLKYQPDNVVGELKGEIESVTDYAKPRFKSYYSQPYDPDQRETTTFMATIRLCRDRGYISIANVALTFWQNYPIADFYYEIQNPVDTEFIPEYDVEKLFLHINGQSFLNVMLTSTGILKLRMYSPVRIVDNFSNVFWLQTSDETGCREAKY